MKDEYCISYAYVFSIYILYSSLVFQIVLELKLCFNCKGVLSYHFKKVRNTFTYYVFDFRFNKAQSILPNYGESKKKGNDFTTLFWYLLLYSLSTRQAGVAIG